MVGTFPTAAEEGLPRVWLNEYRHIEERIYASLAGKRETAKAYAHAVRYGKAATLASMYGGKIHENLVQSQAGVFTRTGRFKMGWNGGHPFARDVSNGPFSVTLYNGKRSSMRGGQRAYKVVNKHGTRVHRGSLSSCNEACEKMNLKFAEYLMLKD